MLSPSTGSMDSPLSVEMLEVGVAKDTDSSDEEEDTNTSSDSDEER